MNESTTTRAAARRPLREAGGTAPASEPTVSIVCSTYNQAPFVRDALEGFLDQEVDFPVEIVVSDDASTDGTGEIVAEYAAAHPGLFRTTLRTENRGVNVNLGEAVRATRGRYVALCEGDDYWIDPLKLSKQVALLDAEPGVAVSFHPVRVRWEGAPGEEAEYPPPELREDLSLRRLFSVNFIQTNSAVYRRLPSYGVVLPPHVSPTDWWLHLLHAQHGEVVMLPETMAVYRRHAGGLWSDRTRDPDRFWLQHGRGHVALAEGVLDLYPGNPDAEAGMAEVCATSFGELAAIRGEEGRAALELAVREHPRGLALGLRALKGRVDRANETMRASRARISQLDAEVEVQRGRITALRERNEKLRSRIDKVRAANARLRQAAEQRQGGRVRAVLGRLARRRR